MSSLTQARVFNSAVASSDNNYTKNDLGPVAWEAPECELPCLDVSRDSQCSLPLGLTGGDGHKRYAFASDVFSFGVTLWEMTTRKRPWAGLTAAEIILQLLTKQTLQLPKVRSPKSFKRR